jgi:hypothetical protein
VKAWSLKRLKPFNISNVKDMMYDFEEEVETKLGGEWIAYVVQIGDNVNGIDETFWIIDEGVHTVQTSFTNGWSNEYVEGDVVLRGFWYDRLSINSRTYLLRDDKHVAYVFSNLILASKFSMPPTCHTFNGKYTSYELK